MASWRSVAGSPDISRDIQRFLGSATTERMLPASFALAAGGGFYAFTKQKQKKQAEKEALDPDANYTEDKGDFEIPTDVPDEDETPDEQDTEPI